MRPTPGTLSVPPFLLHVLPGSFHRIRHYGLLANGCHKANVALARTLLGQSRPAPNVTDDAGIETATDKPAFVCAHCGAAMTIVQIVARETPIRAPPARAPMR
jgi:hypothetical protein